MAKNNNLTDFLTSLANKFRNKLGTTVIINPQDFEDKVDDVYDKGKDDFIKSTTDNNTIFSGFYSRCDFSSIHSAKTYRPYVPVDTSEGRCFNFCFQNCTGATTLPVINTSNGIDFNGMYSNCMSMTTVPAIDTSKGTDFTAMFNGCMNITTVPALDTSKGTDFSSMFSSCRNITTFPALDTSKGTDFSSMFSNCLALETVEQINMTCATNVAYMFYGCSKLKNITFEGSIKANGLSFSYSPLLTHDSIMSAINALYDYTGGAAHSITFGSTNLAKLTAAEKAIATSKNWTLT